MPHYPRLLSPLFSLAVAAAAIGGLWTIAPTAADLGFAINRAAAWASPPRDNVRPMHGNRYRRMERAWEESAREAIRDHESSPSFVGPPSPGDRLPMVSTDADCHL
jgi:hypothetical protein